MNAITSKWKHQYTQRQNLPQSLPSRAVHKSNKPSFHSWCSGNSWGPNCDQGLCRTKDKSSWWISIISNTWSLLRGLCALSHSHFVRKVCGNISFSVKYSWGLFISFNLQRYHKNNKNTTKESVSLQTMHSTFLLTPPQSIEILLVLFKILWDNVQCIYIYCNL